MTENEAGRREMLAILACCAVASLAAIAWSWRHDAILNYGDAEAHLHIARRVIDSHRPGLSQLGSVWLPLPHLLMIPFVAVYGWWADGIAGTIPSALAWLASCAGMYRLARHWMQPLPASIALAFFVLNPNLIYMQTTGMTEPLFVCEMVWAVVWLVEWRAALDENHEQQTNRLTWLMALAMVSAVYTRYDGWIMALIAWTAMGVMLLRRGRLQSRTYWIASTLVVAAPMVWFVYNAAVFGDWLDFARGPYSAAAIELRTAAPGSGPLHPGWHNPWVSLLFFVKVSEMDSAARGWGNVLLVLALLGSAWGWLVERRRAFSWSLLLWFPIPFYAWSVAYGSVPIFIPVWWPHSWYNTRYGLELIPALALGIGLIARLVLGAVREFKPAWTKAVAAILFASVAVNSVAMMREQPLVYMEGTKNAHARRGYERRIAMALRKVLATRPGGIVLMNTSVYPQIVALTGIPLRQTVNESDREYYQAALADPAGHAAVVLAFDRDEVDDAVRAHPQGLRIVARFAWPGQPSGTLYVADAPAAQRPGSASVIASGKDSEED